MSPGQIGNDVATGDASPSTGAVEAVDAAGAEAGESGFAFPSDFENLGDEAQSAQPEGEPAPAPELQPTGAPPAQPQQQQPAAAKPAQTQPAQAAKPPQPTPQAQQPQQPARQPAEQLGPGALAAKLAENRDAIIQNLASNRYKVALTEGETQALEKDAIAALPQILSRLGASLYYDMVQTSLNHINNMVPQLINNGVRDNTSYSNTENAFWQQYPNLDRTNQAHTQAVSQAAAFYRQQNPMATPKEAIDYVGKMASAFLGIPFAAAAQAGRPNGGQPQRGAGNRPFAPAGGGRVVSTQPVGNASDPFAGMGADFDE